MTSAERPERLPYSHADIPYNTFMAIRCRLRNFAVGESDLLHSLRQHTFYIGRVFLPTLGQDLRDIVCERGTPHKNKAQNGYIPYQMTVPLWGTDKTWHQAARVFHPNHAELTLTAHPHKPFLEIKIIDTQNSFLRRQTQPRELVEACIPWDSSYAAQLATAYQMPLPRMQTADLRIETATGWSIYLSLLQDVCASVSKHFAGEDARQKTLDFSFLENFPD